MRSHRILIGLIAVVLLCGTSASQAAPSGGGARPAAMGGAYLALSEGVDGVWYNPSGMAGFEGAAIQLSYAMLYPGLGDDLAIGTAAGVISLGTLGNLGVGVSMLNCDLKEKVGEGIGTNTWKDQTLLGCYSRGFGSLSLGASFKMMMWDAEGRYGAGVSKTSVTLDAGGMYRLGGMFGAEGIRLGVLVSNLMPANISESGDDGGKLPLGIGLGAAMERGNTLTSVDLHIVGGDLELRGGVEVQTAGLWLRLGGLGIANAEDMPKGEVDFGVGLALVGLQVDYAYIYPLLSERELGGHQFFTLGYKF